MLMTGGVDRAKVDMCAYGLKTDDKWGEGFAMKPTGLMSNMESIIEGMPRRCRGDHRHIHLLERKAAAAAQYPHAFCKQIVKCIEIQELIEGGAMI